MISREKAQKPQKKESWFSDWCRTTLRIHLA